MGFWWAFLLIQLSLQGWMPSARICDVGRDRAAVKKMIRCHLVVAKRPNDPQGKTSNWPPDCLWLDLWIEDITPFLGVPCASHFHLYLEHLSGMRDWAVDDLGYNGNTTSLTIKDVTNNYIYAGIVGYLLGIHWEYQEIHGDISVVPQVLSSLGLVH
jgi:hypothetical protein